MNNLQRHAEKLGKPAGDFNTTLRVSSPPVPLPAGEGLGVRRKDKREIALFDFSPFTFHFSHSSQQFLHISHLPEMINVVLDEAVEQKTVIEFSAGSSFRKKIIILCLQDGYYTLMK